VKIGRFKGALLSALMMASIIALATLIPSSPVHAALTSHNPIFIVGNAKFTKPDPVNGGGSGTADDPYIIENWDISAENDNGIEISNTTAYFVIRNCYVHDGRAREFYGIKLDNVINGRLENNTCENNYFGICIFYCPSNNTLINNICKNNSNGGIYLEVSPYHNLINNTCENNPDGICLSYSSYDNLINNRCLKNGDGIYLYYSPYNNLFNNTCENNSYYGIQLDHYSSNNTLINNTVRNNPNGIEITSITYSSNNNHIYHNYFANILTQAQDSCSNFWDNGYPSGGNYWSDYTGADNYRGDNQNIPGSDGIGDTPYYIPGGSNQDRYPLMSPFPFPWTGWSVFGLENLYVVRLEKNLYLAQGSKLAVKFYKYDSTYQAESVIDNFVPPITISENENVPHPSGLVPVEIVRLVLTTDNTANEISTIASFTATKSVLFARYGKIKTEYSKPGSDKPALFKEYGDLKKQYAKAP